MEKVNKNKRIVIIEDHATIAIGLKTILKTVDGLKTIEIARTREEGLNLIKLCKPDIVLLDFNLSGDSGIEIVRKIKEIGLDIHIIIFIEDKFEDLNILLDGISGILFNNMEPISLVRIVEGIINGYCTIPIDVFNKLRVISNKPDESISSILSEMEYETIQLVVQGMTNIEISKSICKSVRSVENYITNIKQKLGVDSRTAIVSAYLKLIKHSKDTNY